LATNYLQFIAEGNNATIFDVPTMSLSSEQLKRAENHFSKLSVKIISVGATDPNRRKSLELNAYQKLIDRKDLESGIQSGAPELKRENRTQTGIERQMIPFSWV